MGVLSTIQKIKDKVRSNTGLNKDEDYIPIENLQRYEKEEYTEKNKNGVEVIKQKVKVTPTPQVYHGASIRERISGAVSYGKQKIAERQLYQKEKVKEQHNKLLEENQRLKAQETNQKLKNKLETAKKKALTPVNANGLRGAFGGAFSGQRPVTGTGFGSTGFNVDEPPKRKKGSNVFGGNPPW